MPRPSPRRLPILAAAAIAITAAGLLPAAALDLPARKPGLWEMTMTFESGAMPPFSSSHCVDAETDRQLNALGGDLTKGQCEKQEMTRDGDAIVVESVCAVGGATMASRAVVTGDFDSAYAVKVTSERKSGKAPPGVEGLMSMTIAAKWAGACKAGQKPGDIMMGNGLKMNIRDLPGAAPR